MTPHAWEPVMVRDRGDGRMLVSDQVACGRCGVTVSAGHAPKVDLVEGWKDCDEMLVGSVIES